MKNGGDTAICSEKLTNEWRLTSIRKPESCYFMDIYKNKVAG